MGLTVVGLPLGNIKDISLRALEALDQATVVICEDTRVFHRLWMKLENLGYLKHKFEGRLDVLNDFNENDKAASLAKRIKDYGEEVLLVSDAGMPTFSDPGFKVIREYVALGEEVKVIPGPTAAETALVKSGMATDRVMFVGFLPKKQSKRDEVWEGVKRLGFGITLVIYEAPGRTADTLGEIKEKFENVEVIVARELTKEYEEIIRNPSATQEYRGEVVILARIN